MGLIQQSKAVFYHPLNDKTEFLESQDWTESTPTYGPGKVSTALGPTVIGDSVDSFGTETEFRVGTATNISVAGLSATNFVVAYRDQSGANHGTAKIGTVSGSDISIGAEVEFQSAGAVQWVSATTLSASVFVVAYRDDADSGHGTARVGTVSGTDITFGAESEFHSSSTTTYISATALSLTKFAVVYKDDGTGLGKANVGTVTGMDITFGTVAEFLSASGPFEISTAALGASKFVVVYRDGANSSHGTAKVGTVSGTDVTFGAEAEYRSSNGAFFNSAAGLSATKFVVTYRDFADSNHGTAKIGTVSGTDISFGAEAEFQGAGGVFDISVVALSSGIFVVAYRDNADSNHGTVKIGLVSGTDVTFGAETEFLSAGSATWISAAALDGAIVPPASANKFAVAYRDNADISHGTAKIGTVPAGTSLTGTGAAYDTVVGATRIAFCGWLKKPSA